MTPGRKCFDVDGTPLAWLRTYRLHPDFSSVNGFSLMDVRWSNRVDPRRTMCRYELRGRCSNERCTFQHVRDVIPLTTAEVAVELAR